jgi:hypothetical protein
MMELLNKLRDDFSEISSSFQSTPVGMERQAMNRPQGRRGRRNISKRPRLYAEEWTKQIKLQQPEENKGYSVHLGDRFQLLYQEQHNGTMVEKFDCDNSHRAIKSAFLMLGLKGYNCKLFCEAFAASGLTLCDGELSPEDAELSYHDGILPATPGDEMKEF